MLTFKQFLSQQEDNISDQDAIKKYNEYKDEFKRQQINEFFLAHKEEEWYLVYIQVCVTCKKISTDYLLIDVTNVKSDNFFFLFHSCLIYIEKKCGEKFPVWCVWLMNDFICKTRRGLANAMHVSFLMMETKLLSILLGEYSSRSLFRYAAHNAVFTILKVIG